MKTIKTKEMLQPLFVDASQQIAIAVILDQRNSREVKQWREMHEVTEKELAELRKNETAELVPVVIRVTQNRKCRYFRTGKNLSVIDYYDMQSAKGNSHLAQIKKEIKSYFDKVRKQVIELNSSERFTFENLREVVTGKTAATFFELWERCIEGKKEKTATSYRYALNEFRRYAGNVDFLGLSATKINKWIKFLQDEGKSSATIGMSCRALRIVVNEAIKQGYIKSVNNPMRGVSIPKSAKRTYECIDIPTINKLRAYKGDAVLEEAVAIWVFSYLAGGANMADILELRYDEHYFQSGGKDLKFTRQKTADTAQDTAEILIPVCGEIKTIIEKFGATPQMGGRVFPQLLGWDYPVSVPATARRIDQANQNLRLRLHKLCAMLSLPVKVSATWARHSFKTNAVHKGIDNIYIEMAMGHSLSGVQSNYMGQWRWEDRAKFVDMLLEDVDIYYMNLEPRQITADEIKKYLANLSIAEKRALLGL